VQNAKRCQFYINFCKKWKFCEKYFRQRKILKGFQIFHEICFFDTSDFITAVQKSLCTPWPLFAGEHFGAQNAFWGPKVHFGPQNEFSGPKMHFGVIFAPWPEMLMKPMVSASDFTLFGVQMRKFALFRTLGLRNAK
jgi:hypothetical protein